MARISRREPVLGGRGCVILHADGTSEGSWFYKERRDGRYVTKKLPNATTLEEAIEQATNVAFEIERQKSVGKLIIGSKRFSQTSRSNRQKSLPIENAVGLYLQVERNRLNAGIIKKTTFTNKHNALSLHLIPYLHSVGRTKTNEITPGCFDNYLIFRSDTTKLVQVSEINKIKEFLRWLVRERFISAEIGLSNDLLPKVVVRQTDRLKNPAIKPSDWNIIISYLRNVWRLEETHNKRTIYFRTMFWHFVLLAKNSGMSPEEILKLQYKSIETKDERRTKSDGTTEEWLVTYIKTTRSKTSQSREIPCNYGRELRRWIQFQREYINEHNLNITIDKNSLVFGNVNNEMKPFIYRHLIKAWSNIREALDGKLNGHPFSPHHYTIYSLRATFIEGHLRKGTDIFLLARIAGHDVKELMRSYERLSVRERSDELTKIDFGKTKQTHEVIDLLLE